MAFESLTAESLTTAQAAAIAEVSPGTVRSWILQGKLHGTRSGPEWRVARDDLDTFLAIPLRRGRPPRPGPPPGPYLVARALLELDGVPATTDELATLIDRHPGNVRKYLLLLEATGHARRVDREWLLTPDGESAYRTEVAA